MAATPGAPAEERGSAALIAMAAANTVASIVVAARAVTRWKLDKRFGLDDGLACNAQVLNLTVMVAHFKVLEYGGGRHLRAVPPPARASLYEWLVAAELASVVGLYLCRLSALALYARLDPAPGFRRYLLAASVFVTALSLVQLLVTALQCVPLAALWGGAEGTCMSAEAFHLSTGLLTIVVDAVILALPVEIIISAIVSRYNRYALGALVAFAVFTFTTPIIHIAYLIPVIYKRDVTWYLPDALAWASVEFSAAVVALSLPALKTLLVPPPKPPRRSEQLDPSRHLAWLDAQVEQHFPLNPHGSPPEMHERVAHADGRVSPALLAADRAAPGDRWQVSSPETAARRLAEERAHALGAEER